MDYMCRVVGGNFTTRDHVEAFMGTVHTAEARTLLRRWQVDTMKVFVILWSQAGGQ